VAAVQGVSPGGPVPITATELSSAEQGTSNVTVGCTGTTPLTSTLTPTSVNLGACVPSPLNPTLCSAPQLFATYKNTSPCPISYSGVTGISKPSNTSAYGGFFGGVSVSCSLPLFVGSGSPVIVPPGASCQFGWGWDGVTNAPSGTVSYTVTVQDNASKPTATWTVTLP
jgi:hypothetical protein